MQNFSAVEENNLDLEQNIDQPQAPIDPNENPNANRYGMSFLINIPLYKHLGNNAMVDVNTKDKNGEVTRNVMYFPRLMLIPFRDMKAMVPAEAPASETTSGSYEANSRQFNPNAADNQGNMIREVTKTALNCANLFTDVYGKDGGVVFNALTGIDTYAGAKKLLMTILPLDDRNIFPRTKRNVLGEQFEAPFLDQILKYLQSGAVNETIEKIAQTEAQEKVLKDIFNEVLAGARNSNSIAKNQIATTEQQMTASPKQKKAYDVRDVMTRNAPDPFDLLCLAHLDEKPKDERQLEQARKMQENNNAPFVDLAKGMSEVSSMMAETLKAQRAPAATPTGMTAAEIAALIKRGVAEGIEEFKRETTAAGAVVDDAQTEEKPATAAKTSKRG